MTRRGERLGGTGAPPTARCAQRQRPNNVRKSGAELRNALLSTWPARSDPLILRAFLELSTPSTDVLVSLGACAIDAE